MTQRKLLKRHRLEALSFKFRARGNQKLCGRYGIFGALPPTPIRPTPDRPKMLNVVYERPNEEQTTGEGDHIFPSLRFFSLILPVDGLKLVLSACVRMRSVGFGEIVL